MALSYLHFHMCFHVQRVPFNLGVVLQSPDKRKITSDEWERKLTSVRVRKDDMNRLVMNFLVTEVRARFHTGESAEVFPCMLNSR